MKFTYGSTMSDLILKLIADRDRLQQALRNTEDRLQEDHEAALK